MGYCPFVERAGHRLYLPVPLQDKSVAISNRLNKMDAPLEEGIFSAASVLDDEQFSLSGLMITGNPQNVMDLATIPDLWVYATTLWNFFFGYSSLPFVLTLAYPTLRMGLNNMGTEYPPLSTLIQSPLVLAESMSITTDCTLPFQLSYSVAFKQVTLPEA